MRAEITATCNECHAFVAPWRLRSAFKWAERHVKAAHPCGYSYTVRKTKNRGGQVETTWRWERRAGKRLSAR